jgi:hypothetical protein
MVDAELLEGIEKLLEEEQWGPALDMILVALEQDADAPEVLNFMGYAMLNLGSDEQAYNWFRRALEVDPKNYHILTNVGKALHEMGQCERALGYFMTAASINPDYSKCYSNAAASLVHMSDWQGAIKAAELALDCDPADKNSFMNLAHCRLATGEFGLGFDAFELALGGNQRKEWTYGMEKRWDGTKKKRVVIYGEQGLGDEIFFAESFPNAIEDSSHVTIDCDPKLAGLFARSFPQATVYGTRRDDTPSWLQDSHQFDYRAAAGSVMGIYRRKAEDFPLKPWLVADPERVTMWKGLFKSYGKPVIGVCLNGGTKKTHASRRKLTLDDLKPLMESIDAVWASLEYKDDPKGLKSFPWATKSQDYDDTAALIAALDAVVGVPTTAIHCADGLGVPTFSLVPTWHNWRYADAWPRLPKQTYIRQEGSWKDTIQNFADTKALNEVVQ